MKKLIKPLVIIVVLLLALFIFMQQFRVENANIGQPLDFKNDVTITVDNIEFSKSIFKDKTIELSDKTAIIISFTLNNAGKEDYTINHSDLKANYDGNAAFSAEKFYLKTGDDWEESDAFVIGKLTNNPRKIKTYILVPDTVIENTEKSLNVTIGTYTFDLR